MSTTETITTREPKPRRWTRDEYYRMGDLGFFQDQRVELIEGEILQRRTQSVPHAAAISLTHEVLRSVFSEGHWVRNQAPLTFSSSSEPEPDIAVVAGEIRDHSGGHPTTALLVVEISDATLAFDRRKKASLYAQAGIADYWVVNLVNRQLEVYRRPRSDQN